MDTKYFNAIKPLISMSSAIIIFIFVNFITFLSQFHKYSYRSVFPPQSTVFAIHFQCVCCSLYLMSQK